MKILRVKALKRARPSALHHEPAQEGEPPRRFDRKRQRLANFIAARIRPKPLRDCDEDHPRFKRGVLQYFLTLVDKMSSRGWAALLNIDMLAEIYISMTTILKQHFGVATHQLPSQPHGPWYGSSRGTVGGMCGWEVGSRASERSAQTIGEASIA